MRIRLIRAVVALDEILDPKEYIPLETGDKYTFGNIARHRRDGRFDVHISKRLYGMEYDQFLIHGRVGRRGEVKELKGDIYHQDGTEVYAQKPLSASESLELLAEFKALETLSKISS